MGKETERQQTKKKPGQTTRAFQLLSSATRLRGEWSLARVTGLASNPFQLRCGRPKADVHDFMCGVSSIGRYRRSLRASVGFGTCLILILRHSAQPTEPCAGYGPADPTTPEGDPSMLEGA
jgi:hypothetical protein